MLLADLRRAHGRVVGAAIAAGVVWQLAVAAVPIALGRAIDVGVVGGDRGSLWSWAAIIVALGLVTAAADALRHRWETLASVRVQVDLRERVAAAALTADETHRDQWPAAALLARATTDVDAVTEATEATGWLVAQTLIIPVTVAILLSIDVVLGLAVIGAVGVAVLIGWRASAAWNHRTEAAQDAMAGYIAEVHSVLDGFKVIRGVGAEAGVLSGIDRRSRAVQERTTHTARLWVVFGPLFEVLSGVATVAVLWVGGERVIGGSLGLGELVAAAGLAVVLADPVSSVGYGLVAFRQAGVSARRLEAVLETVPPDAPVNAAAVPVPIADADDAGPVALSATEVGFDHGNRSVLDKVGVIAVAGEVVVVGGPVGSGKSTLLAVLAGDRAPHRGEVRIEGSALHLGPAPFLLADSVAANLRLGAPDATDADLLAALAVADLEVELDLVLADRGSSLSGGQRQRLALARALLVEPDVLLLDGALSGVEPPREMAILRAVIDRQAAGIVVLVSANPAVETLADRLVVL